MLNLFGKKKPTPSTAATTSSQQQSHVFKVHILGDAKSKKTSVLIRFVDEGNPAAATSTIGVDFKIRTMEYQGITYKLQIYDTATTMNAMATSSIQRGAHGFLICYSITNDQSAVAAKNWLAKVLSYYKPDIPIVIVGTKADKEAQKRRVSKESGQEIGSSIAAPWFEVSAKNNTNITEAFEVLLSKMIANAASTTNSA